MVSEILGWLFWDPGRKYIDAAMKVCFSVLKLPFTAEWLNLYHSASTTRQKTNPDKEILHRSTKRM